MRTELYNIENHQKTFTARFKHFGELGSEITFLFVNLKDPEQNLITDHFWLKNIPELTALNLKPGMYIQFNAKVKPYEKNYIFSSLSGRRCACGVWFI